MSKPGYELQYIHEMESVFEMERDYFLDSYMLDYYSEIQFVCMMESWEPLLLSDNLQIVEFTGKHEEEDNNKMIVPYAFDRKMVVPYPSDHKMSVLTPLYPCFYVNLDGIVSVTPPPPPPRRGGYKIRREKIMALIMEKPSIWFLEPRVRENGKYAGRVDMVNSCLFLL